MTEYNHTAQSFVDALNMKLMPQLGYVLVKKDDGLFWEYAAGIPQLGSVLVKKNDGWLWESAGNIKSYPANEETRKNTGLYRWAIVSADKN